MNTNAPRTRQASLLAAASCGLVLASMPNLAQAAVAREPALAITADDAGLQWGPCPPFLPAGCGIAVLHGDPSKPNADILFKVPGSRTSRCTRTAPPSASCSSRASSS